MVTDHIYAEFGYDMETIKAAIIKHKIDQDPMFITLLNNLKRYKKDSILKV